MPVRKIPKTYGSLSGQLASRKLNRAVAFESSLERDLFTLLEFSEDISTYEEQPLTVEYYDTEQRSRKYTPDVLIVFQHETLSPFGASHILAEVKYRADLFKNWKTLKPKFKAARAYCRKKGWVFRILTEVEIRTPHLENARFLLSYRDYETNQPESETLIKALAQHKIADVSQLLDETSRNETERLQLIPHLWRLIATGKIGTDLNAPLTMKSRIWIGEGVNHER